MSGISTPQRRSLSTQGVRPDRRRGENAGIVRLERPGDLDPRTFEDAIRTTLVGAFTVARVVAPDSRETAGDTVMVSSVGGTAWTVDAAYAASKAGCTASPGRSL